MKVIQSIDPIDLVEFIERKNKIYSKNLLDSLETIIRRDDKNYPFIRKLVLDSQNNFSRMIIRVIMGEDFEGDIS
jgi:hypothetical protein